LKRLIIHIGLAKTGSSSLQRFFQLNQDLLRAKGICYPTLGRGGEKAHLPLFHSQANYLEERKNPNNLFDRFKRELARMPEDCLVSAEADRAKPDIWGERWADCGRKVEILVYLRRQDERLESLLNQKIKSLVAPLEITLEEAVKLSQWDYEIMLRRWARVFGKDAVHVRIYNKQAWVSGNGIYEDAVQALGLEWDNAFQIPAKAFNPSLGYTELYALRHMKEAGIYHLSLFRQIIDRLPDPGQEPFFSAAARLEFLQRFEESNRRVAEQYFGYPPERPLFPGPYPDPADGYQPPQGPDPERLMNLLMAVWKHHHTESIWLRRLKGAKRKLLGRPKPQ